MGDQDKDKHLDEKELSALGEFYMIDHKKAGYVDGKYDAMA